MKARRTLPPAASAIEVRALLRGIGGLLRPNGHLLRLEKEIKEHFDVRHVFLVSSGKAALTLILSALHRLSSRRVVVVPAYTCFSVPSAVVKAGLRVRPSDVDGRTLDYDLPALRRSLDDETLCVLAQHPFGMPADMDRIMSLSEAQGVFVVEDAAQAMGGLYRGRKLGSVGHVGMFSLGRGKNITCGSGGIVVTNSDEIAETLKTLYRALPAVGPLESFKELLKLGLMRAFLNPRLFWLPKGLPFLKIGQTLFETDFPVTTLSGMKAGILMNWRERLARANRERAQVGDYYVDRLGLRGTRSGTVPYLRFPIVLGSREERDRLYAASEESGLGVSTMYPRAISALPEIQPTGGGMACPVAEMLAERLVTLPTHSLVSAGDKEQVCRLVEAVVDGEIATGGKHAPERSYAANC